jgi:hypothetical protein
LAFRQAQENRFRSAELFQTAVDRLNETRLRDPLNPHFDRRLGEWWLERFRVTRDRHHAQEAVSAYEQAWRRYPTNSFLMAELADAYDATENVDVRRAVSRKAVQQDQINRDCGHVDRLLADPVREKLQNWSEDQNSAR